MARPRHKWHPVCDPPQGLVRPVPVDPEGLLGPTRGQAAGPSWRSTSRGLYVPSTVDDSLPEQRVIEASMLLPRAGAVTGWGACRLASAGFFDGLLADGLTRRPVALVTGPTDHRRPRDGVAFRQDRLDPAERIMRHGIPCTEVRRALFDEMRYADDLRDAVVAMDMMAAAELVSIRQMREYVESHAGWQGIEQVRRALPLASEESRSPNETRMRLVWVLDAKLPPPRVNQPVFDRRGNLLGIADLLDEAAGVVGEFDGADHRGAARHSRDVAREHRFRDAGLEYFTVTGPDLPHRDRMAARMLRTRRRALRVPADARRWTLTPPAGWPVDPPLDEVLADRAWQRRLLAEWQREDLTALGHLLTS